MGLLSNQMLIQDHESSLFVEMKMLSCFQKLCSHSLISSNYLHLFKSLENLKNSQHFAKYQHARSLPHIQ